MPFLGALWGLFLLLLLPTSIVRADAPLLHLAEQRTVAAGTGLVWELAGDFCTPHDWNPLIEATQCRGDGRPGTLRLLNLVDGGMPPQKLIQRDPLHRHLAWRGAADKPGKGEDLAALLARPDYHARITVENGGVDQARIAWEGTLQASGDEERDQARIELLRRYYRRALERLATLADRTAASTGQSE